MTLTRLLLLIHISLILYQANAFSMKMIPIHSPQLKVMPQSFTVKERDHFLVNMSLSRAHFVSKRNANNVAPNQIQSTLYGIQGGYQVTELFVGKGTFSYTRYLILDTFADQTWFQCAGCDPCFDLQGGNIRVEDSDSYKRLSLDDERCDPVINYDGACGFEASIYKAHTDGYLGTDTFLFDNENSPIGKELQYFPNIAFGCGMRNENFSFEGSPNMIAGVHGLAPGPKSFLKQLDDQIRGKFAYCIPPITTPNAPMSTIAFGDDAQIGGDDARKVQQISMNPHAYYHLYLAGIVVGGNRLPIDPIVFELDAVNFTKGFFIDAATPVTVLAQKAYEVVKVAMIGYFQKYQMIALPSTGDKPYDLCFENVPDPSQGQAYPTVAFAFVKSEGESGEVQLVFETDNIFYQLPSPDVGFCLAMLPSENPSGPSIFGAYQQANYKFLFDVTTRTLSFVPHICQENN